MCTSFLHSLEVFPPAARHSMFCSHLHFSLISELSELPDPFRRSRLSGLLQQTKKTADASEADQDRQNQQLQTLTVTVRKSLILIRWVWTDCCCNVFMFLLHLSCTGSDQPGHQNYGTLTWRFSISLFLPSGFSPQLHLRVHPRSSHRSLWIQNQLCINILCAELLSSLPFIRCSFCPVIDYWSVWMWGLRSALAASGSINKWSWTWRHHLVSSLWEIKAAQRYITDQTSWRVACWSTSLGIIWNGGSSIGPRTEPLQLGSLR